LKPTVPIRKALADKGLLGNALAGESWKPWRTLLIAAMGEKLTSDERALFKTLTGREHEPLQRVDELAAVVGRRGGKSRAVSVLATYIAGLCDHSVALVPGERGVLLCVALDQKVATIILNYAQALFEHSPILRQLIENRSADALELTNGISLEVRPVSFRRLRGPTYIAVIADELAYWYTESSYANPDIEVLNAVEPGLATTGGPLILASSPYAKSGVLWSTYRQYYGKEGDVLVAHGPSRTFNPTLSQRVVDRALAKDRARASAEYLCQFRADIEGFVALEVVEACVGDYREQAAAPNVSYRAFVDPSGGSEDSFTLAISHRDYRNNVVVIDCVRERRPPFSPEAVVAEFAVLCKSYRITRVTGDRYAGEFPRELFRKLNISYDLAKQTKSELFRDFLPLLNSVRVTLPRNDRLVAQIVGLERRVAAGGRETITHAEHSHDDLANAVAGAARLAGSTGYSLFSGWLDDGPPPEDPKVVEVRRKTLYDLLLEGRPVPF
jgi:hypothetical protein